MRVYLPNKKSQLLYVAPGADVQDPPSDWLHEDGRPITFKVEIKNGSADVDRAMGEYLCTKGYAQRTPLILPFREFIQGAPKAVSRA